MRNYTYLDEWEHALHQIHIIDDTFYGLLDEIEEKLLQSLKWSCNGLQLYLNTCFVCFASFPEDRVIYSENVINIWIAEGLVMNILHILLRQRNLLKVCFRHNSHNVHMLVPLSFTGKREFRYH